MIDKKAYINGEFRTSAKTVEIISPLTLKSCGTIPSLNSSDIEFAFFSARKSFDSWKRVDLKVRVKKIKLFNESLLKQKTEIAEVMHLEIGKNINEAIVEIERTYDYINKTIASWNKIKEKTEIIGQKESHQKSIPLGVVLAISPFNYPINLSLAKIIPALLVGNTVVFKAATNGSLTGGMLAEIIDEVNFPPGVFNYVTGRGRDIGDTLIENSEIDMISFTGGFKVGKNIANKVKLKPLVLELGGNDAAYIRHDADITLAIKETIAGAFSYSGQRCTAIKRVILHKEIADQFIAGLKTEIEKLEVTPVIDLSAAKYIKDLYEDAIKRENEILIKSTFNNNLISPALIKTTKDSRIWNEEPFGPVLPLVIVSNDQDAIKLMNDSNFGLQNSIFTNDVSWAMDVAAEIESGAVNINAKSSRGPDEFPFSGIKDSGFGTQGISYALKSMTRIINIINNKK